MDNDNDIEIVGGDALVYDRSVGDKGIRWRDLQTWWQEEEQILDDIGGRNQRLVGRPRRQRSPQSDSPSR